MQSVLYRKKTGDGKIIRPAITQKGGLSVERVLIISSTEKSVSFFGEMLSHAGIREQVVVSSAGEARRRLLEYDYDLCIINTPLPDEYGDQLGCSIALHSTSEVILVVKAEQFDQICHRVEDCGVITVSKPVNRGLFWNALKVTQAASVKMQRMYCENRKLQQKIDDMRIIDRAKCVLITYLSMSEQEAHRYIEKQAMDMRLPKRDVAEEILKTYEG